MNKEYKDYLLSKQWAEIKIDLYNSRGKKCERCGSKFRIQVHHKHYRNIFREEPNDLEILCDFCHKKEHGISKVGKKKAKLRHKKKNWSLKNKEAKKAKLKLINRELRIGLISKDLARKMKSKIK